MLVDMSQSVNAFKIPLKGVFHVGAHYGQEIDIYEKLGIKDVIMFEPSKKNFEVLEQRVGSKATLVNLGLGSKHEFLDLNIEENNQGMSNSVLAPKLHKDQYPHIKFNSTEKIEVTTLDKWVSDSQSSKTHNILVMDVQGYEFEVLLGSQKTLQQIDLIICEVNRAELYKDCAFVVEIDVFLSYHGFTRVLTNWEGNTWGDAVYVKKKFLTKENSTIPRIPLLDETFAHHKNIRGNDAASFIFPVSKFEWVRENYTNYNQVVVTDNFVGRTAGKKKIAWLLEPKAISPHNYEYVKNHQEEFDIVVTHDLDFIKQIKNGIYAPHGGTWISPDDWVSNFKKSKNVSIIASEKVNTDGHRLRHDAAKLIDNQHRYGRGYKVIESKLDALKDYRFSIVIENSKIDGYFTEKLIDCLITHTIPIYWGSKNTLDVFDARGIISFETIEELSSILSKCDFESHYDNAYDAVVTNAKKAKRFASIDELFLVGIFGIK